MAKKKKKKKKKKKEEHGASSDLHSITQQKYERRVNSTRVSMNRRDCHNIGKYPPIHALLLLLLLPSQRRREGGRVRSSVLYSFITKGIHRPSTQPS